MEDKNQDSMSDNHEEASEEITPPAISDSLSSEQSSSESGIEEIPPTSGVPLEEPEEIKEPTRFQRFMRKALTWLGVIAIAFIGGMITFHFTFYKPKLEQLNQAESALMETEQEASDLASQLETVTAERDALENAQDYRILLSIMVDTYAARLALTEENTAAAKSAISDTEDSLEEIIDVIRDFDTKLAETLPQRLSLIRANIDGNIENAIADCDLMIKDLRDIEKALYQ